MRAREVHDFKQGGDPYRKMNIGQYAKLKIGDKFIVKHDLDFIENKWIIVYSYRSPTLVKGEVLKIIKFYSKFSELNNIVVRTYENNKFGGDLYVSEKMLRTFCEKI